MKLRYQMRGLAVGIIVTALLMGIATDEGRPLTDAEIKAAAAELGMVESDSLKLTDVQTPTAKPTEAPASEPTSVPATEPTEEPGNEPINESTAEPAGEPIGTPGAEPTAVPDESPTTVPTVEPTAAPTNVPTTVPTVEPTVAPTNAPTTEPTSTPTAEPAKEPVAEPTSKPVNGTVLITVNPGETSISVSKTLEKFGLVADAGAYDQYLCDNGYSRRIAVGSFEIPVGASEEEIAKIITRTR